MKNKLFLHLSSSHTSTGGFIVMIFITSNYEIV